jgi:hypothetical protein
VFVLWNAAYNFCVFGLLSFFATESTENHRGKKRKEFLARYGNIKAGKMLAVH